MRSITKLMTLAAFTAASTALAAVSPFATEVTETVGYGPPTGLYDDPRAVLGKPTTRYNGGSPSSPTLARAKLFEGIYNTGPNGERLITTVGFEQRITVKFDHRVANEQANPFGIDLLVFGNAFFRGTTFSSESTNLNTYTLTGQLISEPMRVSVSQDGVNFFTFASPFADDLFPTNAYRWNRATASWTDEEADFTKPVDPAFSAASFANLSAADALDRYAGSGGGTGFDLDRVGLPWIQYVRVEGVASNFDGEIDAFADVAPMSVPEPAASMTVLGLLASRRLRRK